MSDFDYDDVYELENDLTLKGYKTPQQLMEDSFNNVYNRNWKEYLKSIEWDGLWLRHDTPEEKQRKKEELEERKRQHEMENHPFKQWF